jgi:uncharacterized protein (TIGR02145 family)
MKTISFLVLLVFALEIIVAQGEDYQINFTGSGFSDAVDSVVVTNLSQETEVTILGNDVLHLVGTVGVDDMIATKNSIVVFPNPMAESAFVEFANSKTQLIKLDIHNEIGFLIMSQKNHVKQGIQRFEISGLNSGRYTITLNAGENRITTKLISLGKNNDFVQIEYLGTIIETNPNYTLGNRSVGYTEMQYNDGEMILFKGYSDNYSRALTLIPTHSQTVDFEFIPCSDEDGNNYSVVTIGSQTWMAENLNYETINSWWYSSSSENGDIYGRLYKYFAALEACPNDWHLPSDNEWDTLIDYLGGIEVAGGKLKETGTIHWDSPNTSANNSSAFTALPGGYRYGQLYNKNLGSNGYWWSSTVHSQFTTDAWTRSLSYDKNRISRDFRYKQDGFSVRCVKD